MARPAPDPDDFWKRRSGDSTPKAHWIDPDPDTRGMLSADRIQFYVQHADLISRFNPANLKPASYALTLGPLYQINGKNKILSPRNPVLVLPRNSIVFVAMAESLRLPHYLAARFNLSIDLIYQGLLLGTGPQVDPGFQGVLSCPLHNISNVDIHLRLGEHLATIDFIKTTGLGESSGELLQSIETEEELFRRVSDIRGKENNDHRLFADKKRWLRPITDYEAGKKQVSSSVAKLQKSVDRFKKLGTVAAIAALALAVAIISLTAFVYEDLNRQIGQLEERFPAEGQLPGPNENSSRR